MSQSKRDTFRALVRRVRAGDEQAAAALVQRYEPEIRREVRLRLQGASMRRLLDSMDICQSVFARFFVRAALGEFELDEPPQLLKLLVTMAKNDVTNWARRLQRQRRDTRKDRAIEGLPADSPAFHDSDPTPSAQVSASELLAEFRGRMTEAERRIADLRLDERTWEEIGVELGEGPGAVRKRLERARKRISRELGLE